MRIIYIILLIAAAIFYPLYTDELSFLLLITLLIMPFLLLIQLIITTALFKCRFADKDITVFMDEKGEVKLELSNGSVFPVSIAELQILAECPLTGKKEHYKAVVPVPARSTETVSVGVNAKHCGGSILTLEYVKIYDVLRLFSVKRFRKSCSAQIIVVPKINSKYSEEAKQLIADNTCTGQIPDNGIISGSSPDEIIGFREFAPGDRISRIHFKLSSRFDKDIVKIMGSSDSSRYLLTAELPDLNDADMRDKCLERIMSCAYYMNEESAEVYVFTTGKNDSRFEGVTLSGGFAMRYWDNASYFRIARSLCTEQTYASDNTDGFIVCDLSM